MDKNKYFQCLSNKSKKRYLAKISRNKNLNFDTKCFPKISDIQILWIICFLHKVQKNPARPWIIANMDGKIISAHSNCITGLGKSCSHVGAYFFL